jgi:hypothetical protein
MGNLHTASTDAASTMVQDQLLLEQPHSLPLLEPLPPPSSLPADCTEEAHDQDTTPDAKEEAATATVNTQKRTRLELAIHAAEHCLTRPPNRQMFGKRSLCGVLHFYKRLHTDESAKLDKLIAGVREKAMAEAVKIECREVLQRLREMLAEDPALADRYYRPPQEPTQFRSLADCLDHLKRVRRSICDALEAVAAGCDWCAMGDLEADKLLVGFPSDRLDELSAALRAEFRRRGWELDECVEFRPTSDHAFVLNFVPN